MANAPRRLDLVFQEYDPPLYFITFNTHKRRKLLADERAHVAFIAFARAGAERDLAIGRFVIIPNHVHLFARGSHDFLLSQWIRLLKRDLPKSDHLIRHGESYSEKWEYVRQNPVRAGLVNNADEWPVPRGDRALGSVITFL